MNSNLNQNELSSIREVAACHQTASAKLNAFAGQCKDPQIQQMFRQAATEAQKGAQTLIQLL